MKLYEINKAIIDLMDQWQAAMEYDAEKNDGTISMSFELEFGKLQLQFADKINNICKYMRNLDTDNDGIDAEIARLSKIKQSNARKIERLKSYVASSMQSQGLEKTETDLFKLSFRRSTSLEIVDESKVPDRFKEKEVIETIKIDKAAIKKHITLVNEDMEKTAMSNPDALIKYFDPTTIGCQLIIKENLQIK